MVQLEQVEQVQDDDNEERDDREGRNEYKCGSLARQVHVGELRVAVTICASRSLPSAVRSWGVFCGGS